MAPLKSLHVKSRMLYGNMKNFTNLSSQEVWESSLCILLAPSYYNPIPVYRAATVSIGLDRIRTDSAT